jgi:hypothetical protein
MGNEKRRAEGEYTTKGHTRGWRGDSDTTPRYATMGDEGDTGARKSSGVGG